MRLLLRNSQSPGDVLMLTAAVRDLHGAHPGRFITTVQTPFSELWENNPHIVPPSQLGIPDQTINCEYPLIHQSNRRPYHFIHGFTQDLERKLGIAIPVRDFRGDIHLSCIERNSPSLVEATGHRGPYWMMVAGGKYDFTAKWWNPDWYQQVVDHFAGRIQFVQCGNEGDYHPPLRHVINFVGRTGLRDLIRLVYHADGIVCPVTLAMHLAAAVPPRPQGPRLRPCVVISGGREPAHWEMYPGHQFLHTIGALDCCATGGCWKGRCQPAGDQNLQDERLCLQPVRVREDLLIGRCMTLITPAKVIGAIELYYQGGALAEAPSPALPRSSGGRGDPFPAAQSASDIDVRPRGVAITIGVGAFAKLAHAAAREVHARTRLDTVVLGDMELLASGLTDPTSLKFRLFDHVDADNLLYFDADMVCLDAWDPTRYFGGREIVAVRERMVDSVLRETAQWNVPPEGYFNTGFFICNRQAHRRWLAEAESLRHTHPTAFRDQSPLNAARCRLGIPLRLLDRRFNWIGFGGSSLSHDLPVVFAHKLGPDRMDLNARYFEGQYELLAPRVTLDPMESERLAGREFALTGPANGPIHGPRTLHFREDGTILPPAGPEDAGYWFVSSDSPRPVLSLASETRVLDEFIETLGGEWVSTRDDAVRLRDPRRSARPLDETTARPAADQFLASLPPFPSDRFHDRGIVICGGGPKYLPGAWVCIHMLRRLGCRLPIELWHLNEAELPSTVRSALEPLGVRCENAAEVRRRHPVRFLSGWELKPYAVLHSRFQQVLYLDADNVPVRDPTFLFDSPEFVDTGAVFWPDYGRLAPDRSIWRVCQVSYRDEPEFESGQLLIDKQCCWTPLNLAMHMNEHGDFYYRHVHGDKETFHLAWRMTGRPYAMVPHPIEPLAATMCQHDFEGRRLFQHRNMDKWKLHGPNRKVERFWFEDECREILAGLSPLWDCIGRARLPRSSAPADWRRNWSGVV